MKKTALLAAATALFVAAPAIATANPGGHVGLTYSNTEVDDDDADTWQLDGAVGSSAGAFGWQLDAGLGNTETDDDDDFDHNTIAGHLYWQGGSWRLGAVLASTTFDDGDDEVDEIAYGLEGTFDLTPNTVLLGSYTVGESEFLVDLDTWNADLGLVQYFSDNFRVGGSIGTGNLDAGPIDDDTTTFNLNAEWQPWSTPVSFMAAWNSFETDDFLEDVESISIGARWNFGGSLRERDNATPFNTRTGLYQRAYGLQ